MNALPQITSDVELKDRGSLLVAKVKEFKVTDQSSMEEAGRLTKAIAALQKEIHETFDPVVDSANKTHKAAIAARTSHLEPLVLAEAHLKGEGRRWLLAEHDRKRQEELKRKREEDERIEAERKSNELLQKAIVAEENGNKAEASALLDEAAESQPPVFQAAYEPAHVPVTKVAGLGSAKVWKWKVTDRNSVPREYMILNETILNALAKSSRGALQIPGIEFYQDIEMRRGS